MATQKPRPPFEIPERTAPDRGPFWDEKYLSEPHLFGTEANAFVRAQAHRIPPGSRVLELAAGEGRNAVFLARRGHAVTAVDVSPVALHKAAKLAEAAGVDVDLVEADVLNWQPEAQWEAVVVTFFQPLPEDRPAFYRFIQQVLRPGGVFIGAFFRPEQITEGYTSGGPPTLERMITAEELRRHFSKHEIVHCEETEVELDDGPILSGPAAVVHFVMTDAGGSAGH